MDDFITLSWQQCFNGPMKVSKSKSLIKRRFQSIGLNFITDEQTLHRIGQLEKGVTRHVGQFCLSNNADSLMQAAILLSDLFLLKGELKARDRYGDIVTFYWSIALGPAQEWMQTHLNGERFDHQFVSFKIFFDEPPARALIVNSNQLKLGGYLLPYFVDFSKAASAFINVPAELTFARQQRLKSPVHPSTTFDHIVAIEDSPFLSRLKYKLVDAIDKLPDQACQYSSTFNYIIDKIVIAQLNSAHEPFNSPDVCSAVVSKYTDTLLTLPVFNTKINERYRSWTPWEFNFGEFARMASKSESSVYLPVDGQISWKSEELKQFAEHTLIRQIIPSEFHWHLGIPTMWRNEYHDHTHRIAMMKEWGSNHV